MAAPPDASQERLPLTRGRILECALAVADAGGIGSLTIRSLATELGVKPMSVYHYVPNKGAILDGIVDLVFAEMEIASTDDQADWRSLIVRRAHATRRVLRRHTWAIGLLESRETRGPATLRHHDETLGILRAAGFSVEMTAHAYALLDSFVYGFALQEAARPFGKAVPGPNGGPPLPELPDGEDYPHLAEMAEGHILRPGYDFGDEFELGLDLILGALARSIHTGDLTVP
jgi:AcrR family transcriptional regulator